MKGVWSYLIGRSCVSYFDFAKEKIVKHQREHLVTY